MSVRAQVAGLLREATCLLDLAADDLGEPESLSAAGRDELGELLQDLERADDALRKAWGRRVIREAREEIVTLLARSDAI